MDVKETAEKRARASQCWKWLVIMVLRATKVVYATDCREKMNCSVYETENQLTSRRAKTRATVKRLAPRENKRECSHANGTDDPLMSRVKASQLSTPYIGQVTAACREAQGSFRTLERPNVG
jgi:hypothetical protein